MFTFVMVGAYWVDVMFVIQVQVGDVRSILGRSLVYHLCYGIFLGEGCFIQVFVIVHHSNLGRSTLDVLFVLIREPLFYLQVGVV